MDQYSLRPPQRMGVSAILAVLASLGSMFFSCSGHPGRGLILAALSIPFGLVGFIRAASPEIKGGIASIMAIIIGVVGIAVALIAMFFKIVLF
jgi:hypothetical protein